MVGLKNNFGLQKSACYLIFKVTRISVNNEVVLDNFWSNTCCQPVRKSDIFMIARVCKFLCVSSLNFLLFRSVFQI